MQLYRPLIQSYYSTILGFTPTSFARMTPAGSSKKYVKIHRPPSFALIAAHLHGDITIATPLISTKGMARALVLDIDNGGEAALIHVLDYAEIAGVTAFAVTSTNSEHDGGHVWALFGRFTEAERLRTFAQHLTEGAGVTAEVYPSRKSIRLPFGKHTWTGRRGILLLQDGTRIDLDSHMLAVAHAIKCIKELTQNPLYLLPSKERPRSQKRAQPSQYAQQGVSSENPIYDYNHTTNLLEWLISHGGRIAEAYPQGSYLLHCPCGHHNHGDATPSLHVLPARNPLRYGQYVAVGFAPSCLFYTERGQVIDAFSVYCKMDQLSPKEAIKQYLQSRS